MFKTFDVNSVSATTSSAVKIEHGESYPAQILGLWNASKTYNDVTKNGMGLLIAVADENGKVIYRSLFMSLDGYVLGAKANYAKIMGGLLRVSDTDEALQRKIREAGLGDLSALVGRPCLARMIVKERGDKSWATIDTIAGETSRSKGLSLNAATLEPIDIRKVFGKFIEISDLADCVHMDGLRVTDPLAKVDDGMENVVRDDTVF